MFLSTIREIIMNKPECLKKYLDVLMPLYINQAKNDDEPIRNIVAESIGKLFVTHPQELSPILEKSISNSDPVTIATCVKSFKYSGHSDQNPNNFIRFIPVLINLIKSPDLNIKKNAIDSLG